MANLWLALLSVTGELALFSGVGFLLVGIDELIVDAFWWGKGARKIPTLETKSTLAQRKAKAAIFVATWREANVIGAMLRHMLAVWNDDQDFTIFVGCYPNDPDTVEAVRQIETDKIQIILVPHAGPTTKGDCLNALWRHLSVHEDRLGEPYSFIVLHDAEDIAHRSELAAYRHVIDQHAVVQIPVLPEIDNRSRWVSGHYLDEFAENHSRDMLVRQAVGASLPLAGVGCAISRNAMQQVANRRRDKPFDPQSLTEDYELGLLLGQLGFKQLFLHMLEEENRRPIAVRAYFPASVESAIRQKTRWTVGIALLGWQRLGWNGGLAETWMRLRDRRSILSALLILASYISLFLWLSILLISHMFGWATPSLGFTLSWLFGVNLALLFWRACVRAYFVNRLYGSNEALRSIPRLFVSGYISVAAARRAVFHYLRYQRSGKIYWDKTDHVFPAGPQI